MNLTITTERVLTAYRVLSTAKYGKMSDEDKVKVWKIARAMKPVATQFEDDSKDAAEKFKEGYKDFDERLQKAQEYERKLKDQNLDASTLPIGPAEYDQFLKEFKAYNKNIEKALEGFAKKEVTLEYDPISEDAFGKLMASNEWTMDAVTIIGELIVE